MPGDSGSKACDRTTRDHRFMNQQLAQRSADHVCLRRSHQTLTLFSVRPRLTDTPGKSDTPTAAAPTINRSRESNNSTNHPRRGASELPLSSDKNRGLTCWAGTFGEVVIGIHCFHRFVFPLAVVSAGSPEPERQLLAVWCRVVPWVPCAVTRNTLSEVCSLRSGLAAFFYSVYSESLSAPLLTLQAGRLGNGDSPSERFTASAVIVAEEQEKLVLQQPSTCSSINMYSTPPQGRDDVRAKLQPCVLLLG
ncbi:unnamed protein product [Pleuronectes platessa]|uniref:Uncharacterized protein n=1 Tax=Pleuronectes platessa TaxID=8262 RepID=A0A9N7VDQ5_PLEPL|nr:unnamed protein product [Pleuronectes platessa]